MNHIKVLFRYFSNVLDETTVETMWAIEVDKQNGIYKLDSIPFYGPQIATDDEFFAEYDESEQMLTYRYTTKFSGNSILLISIIKEGIDKEVIRDEFRSLQCESEGLGDHYFSMEILASSNFLKIKERLDEYEDQGILEYAAPCLSDKHRNDNKN
ncbi:DUF4265 domain-containing protein [Flammeovirga sp. MY04]|uniref:DUF4265 domain-containing protein n=1 Tax=Flammeovirga sp. MY04 TaxID=1191459 RepID=UPI000825CE27|nr:DUF4265 domain-containing protein [Flammeovirga sp. MY04]ANQ51736.2 DUF4265 domain-containing protein [Flammeovirga sp. MY04]